MQAAFFDKIRELFQLTIRPQLRAEIVVSVLVPDGSKALLETMVIETTRPDGSTREYRRTHFDSIGENEVKLDFGTSMEGRWKFRISLADYKTEERELLVTKGATHPDNITMTKDR